MSNTKKNNPLDFDKFEDQIQKSKKSNITGKKQNNSNSLKKQMPSPILAGFVIFSLLIGGWYLYSNNSNNTAILSSENKEIISRLNEFYDLPKEKPTFAVVKDKDALQDFPVFFNMSKNGDKVIFYKTSKKAFLFRPSTNKLIDVVNIKVSDTK